MRSSSPITMPSTSESWTLCSSRLHLGGIAPLDAVARGVGVQHCGVFEEFDDPAELRFFTDRELERRDAGSELLVELIERAREGRALAVELVHEDRSWESELLGHAPGDLGLHFDALDCGDDEDREVGGAERGSDVADEVGVPGGVEHVDLDALVLEGCDAERRGDPASGFLGVEVGDRVAVLHPALAGDRPGDEEQRLGERRLARSAVADECDVAKLVRRVGLGRHRHPQVR